MPKPSGWNTPESYKERVPTWVLAASKVNGGVSRAFQYNTNQQGANSLGKGLPVTQMDAAKQSQLPAV